MTELNFSLHKGQMEVFNDPHRFKIVVAGRRWGKTRLSAISAIIEALKDTNEAGYDLKGKNVYYIAPTFDQAKRNIWEYLKEFGKDIITGVHENSGAITILNKCKIEVKGADRPDTLRGVGLRYVILDEYADMKPQVWETIIRPTLTDVKGKALFIGTPKGKNHFYELYLDALNNPDTYSTFQYKTTDNPTLPQDEVEVARTSLSSDAFRQEFEANFENSGSGVLKEEWIKYDDKEPKNGYYFVTLDPAGFIEQNAAQSSKYKKLDEAAIAIVKVADDGTWWVKDIQSGRWGVRETALRYVKACKDVHAMNSGIERGALMNALMPYIEDTKRRTGVFPNTVALTHGGTKKAERIQWALQGRFEHGKIVLNKGEWNKKFVEQYLDFPNPKAHDDLIDALAYIEQIAVSSYLGESDIQDDYQPLDLISGY